MTLQISKSQPSTIKYQYQYQSLSSKRSYLIVFGIKVKFPLLVRHELNAMTVRAELVEASGSAHISTSLMRTDSWINHAGSIESKNHQFELTKNAKNTNHA
jgi:hypothetical protein